MNGGLTLVLPAMCALTRRCSPPDQCHGELFHFINQRPRKSGVKDDVWEGADSDQYLVCP